MKIKSCNFNMDNACVELRLEDGTLIYIDTVIVENMFADNMYQRAELEWLIYNRPLEYVQLVIYDDICGYLHGFPEHKLFD